MWKIRVLIFVCLVGIVTCPKSPSLTLSIKWKESNEVQDLWLDGEWNDYIIRGHSVKHFKEYGIKIAKNTKGFELRGEVEFIKLYEPGGFVTKSYDIKSPNIQPTNYYELPQNLQDTAVDGSKRLNFKKPLNVTAYLAKAFDPNAQYSTELVTYFDKIRNKNNMVYPPKFPSFQDFSEGKFDFYENAQHKISFSLKNSTQQEYIFFSEPHIKWFPDEIKFLNQNSNLNTLMKDSADKELNTSKKDKNRKNKKAKKIKESSDQVQETEPFELIIKNVTGAFPKSRYALVAATPPQLLEYILATRINKQTIYFKKIDFTEHEDHLLDSYICTHVYFLTVQELALTLQKLYFGIQLSKIQLLNEKLVAACIDWTLKIIYFVYRWVKTIGEYLFRDDAMKSFLKDLDERVKQDSANIGYDAVDLMAEIIGSLNQYLGNNKRTKYVQKNKTPNFLGKVNGSKKTLLDLDSKAVARYLTKSDWNAYKDICVLELFFSPGEKYKSKRPNLAKFVESCNNFTNKVTTIIVANEGVKTRANYIGKFLEIAKECLLLNNVSSVFAIMSSLNNSIVARLKKSWEIISKDASTTNNSLQTLMDINGNNANYRKYFKILKPSYMLFMGTFLSDMTFISENPTYIKGKYLNLFKLNIAWEVVRNLLYSQSGEMNAVKHGIIQDEDLEAEMYFSSATIASEEENYRLSTHWEPRTSTTTPPVDISRENKRG